VDHRIPLVGGVATATLDRIEGVLRAATIIETSDAAKLRAAERGLHRLAPCHHENKNGMPDALIVETYFEQVRNFRAAGRFAFVTHNKHDFSDPSGNQKVVHPDLENEFSKVKSLYFIFLGDCLRRINPGLLQEVIWENNYDQEVRSLSDILKAMDPLTSQIWYNRHKNREWAIRRRKVKLVTREEWDANWQRKKGYVGAHIIDTIWDRALKAARRAERKLGPGNYGPWTDFEWGMLNGKLSALRWVLGDEWDMLDT
jgi:PIN domain